LERLFLLLIVYVLVQQYFQTPAGISGVSNAKSKGYSLRWNFGGSAKKDGKLKRRTVMLN
jgi:hypothetical protein